MGCCISIQGLDHDRIHSPTVLQAIGDHARFHGTTERHRCQTLGQAELILTEDGIYSQVLGSPYCCCCCCSSRGYLHIPLRAITNIQEQPWFNGLYRIDRPHLVVSYIVPDKGEFQAGWQMTEIGYAQWKAALEALLERIHMSDSD